MRRSSRRGLAVLGATLVVVACSSSEGSDDGDAGVAGLDASTGADGAGPADGATGGGADGATGGGDDGGSDASTTDAGADASATDAGGDAGAPGPRACVPGCVAGMKRCGARCVPLDDPRWGCNAATCTACASETLPHAVGKSFCQAGACVVGGVAPACRAGWGNCDNDWKTGCETDLSNTATCGTCDNACAAGQVCDAGVCRAACSDGRDDCGGGSCHDVASDPLGCVCNVCPDKNATPTCNAGVCGLGACDPGTKRCVAGGACEDTQSDVNHCGVDCSACLWPTDTGTVYNLPAKGVACVAGVCRAQCTEGYTSCTSGRNTACADLEIDNKNCGACGRTCGAGATCRAGVCVHTASIQFASALLTPTDIAIDATHLYVSESGGVGRISRIDKATAARSTIVSGEGAVTQLTIDATWAYWATAAGIRRAPLAGGAAETLYAGTGPVAVDDTSVYFMDASPTIWKAPKAGGGVPEVLLTGRRANQLIVDATRVYGWAFYGAPPLGNTRYVYGVDKNTKAATFYMDAANDQGARSIAEIAVDGSRLYLGYRSPTTGYIFAYPLAGGGAAQIEIGGTTYHKSIVADPFGCGVYWSDGRIRKINSAAAPLVVANAVTGTQRLVTDESYVYWTDTTFVGRMPK